MAVIELLTVKGKKIIEHGDTCWEVEDNDMDVDDIFGTSGNAQ